MNIMIVTSGAVIIALIVLFFQGKRIDAYFKRKEEQRRMAGQIADQRYWEDRRQENLVANPYIKPAWATHQIELTEDYVWYHMLPDVIPKGTVTDARMNPDGTWLAHINDGLTTGDFDFPDDIVKVLKHY